ncbi:hypothetical protein D3C85_1741110 [compost metagenome]
MGTEIAAATASKVPDAVAMSHQFFFSAAMIQPPRVVQIHPATAPTTSPQISPAFHSRP